MGFINKTTGGGWKAFWRDPQGKQRSKTFRTKKDASVFLAQIETQKSRGEYISPHAGRVRFADHAQRWMDAKNTEATTTARDESIMRNHVLPKWGDWQLAKIDHLSVQEWLTALGRDRSATLAIQCQRLLSGVLRSAVHNRLIAFNPAEGVRLPSLRKRDTDERIIDRDTLRSRLLPAVPDFYRAVVATAAGTGLRWGEVAGLCPDALDLEGRTLRVVRTVIEVNGHTEFKAFPKTRAGRRTIPLPAWLVTILRQHLAAWPPLNGATVFTNTVGGPLRRTLFRSRVWKPSLVRAGLLGSVTELDTGAFQGEWTDATGTTLVKEFDTHDQAVKLVAKHAQGGLRFHDLRHSYATWLVSDGVPINTVQRVMGHEKVTTTLQLYTHSSDHTDQVLRALGDDPDDEPPTASVPVSPR
jgi:integrase